MSHIERFRVLTEPGLIGDFTHCELTEIFASVEGIVGPQNIFTIAVVEVRDKVQAPIYLNPERLVLKSLKGWTFGIRRSVLKLADFDHTLEELDANGTWTSWGEKLGTAPLCPTNPQFVPPDQATPVPLNKVLKNNFWSGSHILEWADPKKALLKPLLDKPERLAELAAAIAPFVPIDLAVVSDRLGNIVVQLPVTILVARCGEASPDQGYHVQVAWRPGTSSRPLRVTVTADYDGTVTGLATAVVEREPLTLAFTKSAAEPRAFLLDENRNVIVAATGPLSAFSQIAVNMYPMGPAEPRTLEYVNRAGIPQSKRVVLRPQKHSFSVGEPRHDPNGGFTQERLYRFETERVRTERLFEQYGLPDSNPVAERARAAKDLHYLISQHGEEGSWLWDPYLDAIDLIETLFLSPHAGADLRGLGRGKNVRDHDTATFITTQKRILHGLSGNLLGIKFEFRVAHSLKRVDFHDRFLIFPRKNRGDLAWSLGTSVRSLGEAHHILQRVEDGQRVSDAFQKLWERMGPSQMVWRRP